MVVATMVMVRTSEMKRFALQLIADFKARPPSHTLSIAVERSVEDPA
jgi:hypothetical protein